MPRIFKIFFLLILIKIFSRIKLFLSLHLSLSLSLDSINKTVYILYNCFSLTFHFVVVVVVVDSCSFVFLLVC